MLVKNLPTNEGDTRDRGSIPGSGKSPGVGNDNPLPYPHPENPMDRGAWWATVRGAAESLTRLSTQAVSLPLNAPVTSMHDNIKDQKTKSENISRLWDMNQVQGRV